MPAATRGSLISAVIPTRNRADLVTKAVTSALSQTARELEVVVVVDGPDPETVRTLARVPDSRLKVVELPHSVGGAEARNAGVRASRGGWIAFLDDDDEWLPEKLERQLKLALSLPERYPVVACRLYAKTPAKEFVWPKRLPEPGEPVGDYLFDRNTLFQGEALVQTSMLFGPRDLFLEVPFTRIPRHQDWDWLFRASALPGFTLVFDPAPLVNWYIDETRSRISTRTSTGNWEFSLEWIARYRDRITPRSYAAFLLTVSTDLAKREGEHRAFRILVREAFRNGRPSLRALGVFCAIVGFPKGLRHGIRRFLARS